MENRLNSYKLLRILTIPLVLTLALLLVNYGIIKARAEDKLLPIYCVDRSADTGSPKVALSFDAAWGDGR